MTCVQIPSGSETFDGISRSMVPSTEFSGSFALYFTVGEKGQFVEDPSTHSHVGVSFSFVIEIRTVDVAVAPSASLT